jgi:hypothetical protein
MLFKTYDAFSRLSLLQINKLTKFIYQYQVQNDFTEQGIRKAIQYAAKERPGFGGLIVTAEEGNEVIGAVILNKTGFEGYLPENLLVSIAVHHNYENKDVYRKIVDYVINYCCGDIGVQLKETNPLVPFFENQGFEYNYIQMNLKQ